MPTYRGTTFALHSQYDAAVIPEHLTLPNHDKTQNILIPSLPNSQFWLSYSCARPPDAPSFSFYLFKLFVRGKCVLSWGTGPEDNWSGKTVFGLYDAGSTDFEGRRWVEKRGFFFPAAPPQNRKGEWTEGFEVRVYRAKARRRISVGYERVETGTGKAEKRKGGLELATIGRKHRGERQRMYEYALVDAKDEPFVAFKYRFCEEGHFNRLQSVSDVGDVSNEREDDLVEFSPTRTIPIAIDPSITTTVNTQEEENSEPSPTPKPTRRLSIPPTTSLTPTTKSIEPTSPIKQLPSPTNVATPSPWPTTSTNLSAPPNSPTRNNVPSQRPNRAQTVCTPSPSPLIRDRGSGCFTMSPGTPPSQRKQATGGLLKGVVASALKRKQVGSGVGRRAKGL